MDYEIKRFRTISDELEEEYFRYLMDFRVRSDKIRKQREELAKTKVEEVERCRRLLDEKHS